MHILRHALTIARSLGAGAFRSSLPRGSSALPVLAVRQALAFERLAHKDQTAALAVDLGVRRPLSRELRGSEDATEVAASLKFPVVFQSPLGRGTLRYAAETGTSGAVQSACLRTCRPRCPGSSHWSRNRSMGAG